MGSKANETLNSFSDALEAALYYEDHSRPGNQDRSIGRVLLMRTVDSSKVAPVYGVHLKDR